MAQLLAAANTPKHKKLADFPEILGTGAIVPYSSRTKVRGQSSMKSQFAWIVRFTRAIRNVPSRRPPGCRPFCKRSSATNRARNALPSSPPYLPIQRQGFFLIDSRIWRMRSSCKTQAFVFLRATSQNSIASFNDVLSFRIYSAKQVILITET